MYLFVKYKWQTQHTNLNIKQVTICENNKQIGSTKEWMNLLNPPIGLYSKYWHAYIGTSILAFSIYTQTNNKYVLLSESLEVHGLYIDYPLVSQSHIYTMGLQWVRNNLAACIAYHSALVWPILCQCWLLAQKCFKCTYRTYFWKANIATYM